MPSPTAPLSLPQELGTPIPPQGWLVTTWTESCRLPPPEQTETDKVCLGFATGSRDVPRVSWSKRWISIAFIQPRNPPSARNVNFCNGLLTFAPCHPQGSSLQRMLFTWNTLYGEKKNGHRYTIILETLHCILTEGRRPGWSLQGFQD